MARGTRRAMHVTGPAGSITVHVRQRTSLLVRVSSVLEVAGRSRQHAVADARQTTVRTRSWHVVPDAWGTGRQAGAPCAPLVHGGGWQVAAARARRPASLHPCCTPAYPYTETLASRCALPLCRHPLPPPPQPHPIRLPPHSFRTPPRSRLRNPSSLRTHILQHSPALPVFLLCSPHNRQLQNATTEQAVVLTRLAGEVEALRNQLRDTQQLLLALQGLAAKQFQVCVRARLDLGECS